ncbi:MAG: DUF4350 domain-containing protein [Chloroflexota bacterium]|nr:DUF4350 domain-containing protein [Chloroflexota bacterium]
MKLAVSLILVGLITLAALVWHYPSNRDFALNNPSWNGLSDFVSDFNASAVNSITPPPIPPSNSVLIMIPYTPFADPELQALDNWLSAGGTLILMDDYGYGNQLLEYLDVSPRFTNIPLLDPIINNINPSFPTISHFTSYNAPGDNGSIVLNHACSLDGVNDEYVIAESSRFSFLDQNNNSVWDEGEPHGPFTVAGSMVYESGRLVLLSDPSILIMLDIVDNKDFLETMIIPSDENYEIFIDESHLPRSTLENTQEIMNIVRANLMTPHGTIILLLGIIALVLLPTWRKYDWSFIRLRRDRT